jgi:hypothetical protein
MCVDEGAKVQVEERDMELFAAILQAKLDKEAATEETLLAELAERDAVRSAPPPPKPKRKRAIAPKQKKAAPKQKKAAPKQKKAEKAEKAEGVVTKKSRRSTTK